MEKECLPQRPAVGLDGRPHRAWCSEHHSHKRPLSYPYRCYRNTGASNRVNARNSRCCGFFVSPHGILPGMPLYILYKDWSILQLKRTLELITTLNGTEKWGLERREEPTALQAQEPRAPNAQFRALPPRLCSIRRQDGWADPVLCRNHTSLRML